jgi:hypothetical protein
MGRSSLNIKPTLVRLSDQTKRRIEAVAGSNGMAELIRDAVERELQQRERANDKEAGGDEA